ncbi:phosphate-repressible phosphate permease [Plectosphaerella cucumerina]|uniref:Phosphate transporter n=1 Tax=Plectosphaerella cucumerina TaxID=40658 RepID=A0A8K0X698_9PEZI|nr:phosphate-repressible phosphate permease [Plectosphaerella cucumerina]
MAVLSQYDYLFALCTIFAFLDAWNIGANDVANSFATSVSSRSLTMKQAMAIAAVMEFSGSVAVGSRVTDTIRLRILDPQLYSQTPSVLLLAMTCTIVGSSIFLTIATRHGLPVSTTHSLIGGLVGTATASVGIKKVNWGIDGASQVFAAWVVAPGIAGIIGAGLFLFTKHFILTKHNAPLKAFYSIPVYTFITVALLTMLVAWKGIQTEVEPTTAQILKAVFITAGGTTALQAFFLLPWIWRKIMQEDWQLKWKDIWQGPWLLYKPLPPPPPAGISRLNIKNYYRGHLTPDELAYMRASESLLQSIQTSQTAEDLDKDDDDERHILPPPALELPGSSPPMHNEQSQTNRISNDEFIPPRPPGPWNSMAVIIWRVNRFVLRGMEKDVIAMQQRNAILSWDIEDMHARSPHYDNRAEYMYSALQILTASAASFIHGANDVSNSVGPFTTAWHVWRTGEIPNHVGVPIWILAVGGLGIVVGLLTYGYHVMRNLGNRLTLISPSRGFCMELGSAITILIATRLSLPVSTTQCIAGAVVGVGLANGDWRCINPRLVTWIYAGWIITLPTTALISGSLMAIIMNAPRWSSPA